MSDPTPEAIEAAARALMWKKLPFGGKDATVSLDANAAHAAAQLALSAAYPLMEAQAKAEALREAAANFPAELPEFAYTRPDGLIDYIDVQGWLKVQAHQELGPTHCQTCGIDLQYPTARHIIDCPRDVTS